MCVCVHLLRALISLASFDGTIFRLVPSAALMCGEGVEGRVWPRVGEGWRGGCGPGDGYLRQ